jgi:V/A-type H+-transporting ATPase subunit B
LREQGIDADKTLVRFKEEVAKIDVSVEVLGRVLNGLGKPIDGGPPILPEAHLDIQGSPINPYSRAEPKDFIQTGVSCIDGLNTLVRGQKLPIFAGAGLPAMAFANCKASFGKSGRSCMFSAMGIRTEGVLLSRASAVREL